MKMTMQSIEGMTLTAAVAILQFFADVRPVSKFPLMIHDTTATDTTIIQVEKDHGEYSCLVAKVKKNMSTHTVAYVGAEDVPTKTLEFHMDTGEVVSGMLEEEAVETCGRYNYKLVSKQWGYECIYDSEANEK